MRNESEIIARIARAMRPAAGGLSSAPSRLILGIGDDAALFTPSRRSNLVLTSDAFLEGVHFVADVHPPDSVGYKSLVRATSDIAAMGASPTLFLLTLCLPASRTGPWLDAFLGGMARAARSMGLRLAGGDTTKSPKIAISITVVGEIQLGQAVTRSGARPGHVLYVSGQLGRAELGLALVRRGLAPKAWAQSLVRDHFYPAARLRLGAWLARHRLPTSMMDLSDGLSTDLARLCAASHVGAVLSAERIPHARLSQKLAHRIQRLKLDPRRAALHGGDDYELLFTLPPNRARALRKAPGFSELIAIGEITREHSILLRDSNGRTTPLKSLGWDPFRNK
jgi:thiamine-monophosphate kinase